jgi:hypothetical protein
VTGERAADLVLRLGDEAERGACADEIGEVILEMGGNQDDGRAVVRTAGQLAREIEAALLPRSMSLSVTSGRSSSTFRTASAFDEATPYVADSLPFEQPASGLEKTRAVVNQDATKRHASTIP